MAKPGVVFISFATCLSFPRIPLYVKKYFAALITNSVFVFVFMLYMMQYLIYYVKYYFKLFNLAVNTLINCALYCAARGLSPKREFSNQASNGSALAAYVKQFFRSSLVGSQLIHCTHCQRSCSICCRRVGVKNLLLYFMLLFMLYIMRY